MKSFIINSFLTLTLGFAFITSSYTQVSVDTLVSPAEMCENLKGPGITVIDNITLQGSPNAYGAFSGAAASLGIESGIVMCTGNASDIPGPNSASNTGLNNGTPGHPKLENISTGTTRDAVMMVFDFVPLNNTLHIRFIFGSEEYNENVGAIYNDLCGIFLTGPDPLGGVYNDLNIGHVPEATPFMPVAINNVNNGYAPPGVVPVGPCQNCQYYTDNTNGQYLEYDGFTTVLHAFALVVPQETYHIALGVADVISPGNDSGVFLEEDGMYSPGQAVFTSFQFLKEHNPNLSFDIIGVIGDNEVHLEVPEGTDLSDLVANFAEPGAFVRVDGLKQVPGVTPNDFTNPLIYTLMGYTTQNWTVYVDIASSAGNNYFRKVGVGPNPAKDHILITHAAGSTIKLTDLSGRVICENEILKDRMSISVEQLPAGIYFVELNCNEKKETRKIFKK